MRSEASDSKSLTSSTPSRDTGRLWWGLFVGLLLVMLLAIASAISRAGRGIGNRGPGEEIAPGANPARDIDRSQPRQDDANPK
jgi:hypothetical protein